MKLNKKTLAVATISGSVSMVNAAEKGHGKMTFFGSVIDAPCSVQLDLLTRSFS